MNMSDSCRETINKVIDSDEGWENYLNVYDCDVTDANFEEVQKQVSDSIMGILANAAIAIAEQKKLLQSAKNPDALKSAVKLVAVTGGNLLHAGVGMLNWASNTLTRQDSAPQADGKFGSVVKLGTGILGWAGKSLTGDSAPREDVEVLFHDSDTVGSPALLFDHRMGDYLVAENYSEDSKSYSSCLRGLHDESTAVRIYADRLRSGHRK